MNQKTAKILRKYARAILPAERQLPEVINEVYKSAKRQWKEKDWLERTKARKEIKEILGV
jgi:hypothetical protein